MRRRCIRFVNKHGEGRRVNPQASGGFEWNKRLVIFKLIWVIDYLTYASKTKYSSPVASDALLRVLFYDSFNRYIIKYQTCSRYISGQLARTFVRTKQFMFQRYKVKVYSRQCRMNLFWCDVLSNCVGSQYCTWNWFICVVPDKMTWSAIL